MSEVGLELKALEDYLPKIKYLNEHYITGHGRAEEQHKKLVAAVRNEFDLMRAESIKAYSAHVLHGARSLSKRNGQRTAPLDFPSDYYALDQDGYRPTYVGDGLRAGPRVEGNQIWVTIGGVNVKGTVSGYAKLTEAAIQRMTMDRVIALRGMLQALLLEDDLP